MTRAQQSASISSRAQSRIRLASFIGQDDTDILHFFLAHYRGLGVTEFHIFIHGDWTAPEIAPLRAKDVTIAGIVQGPFDEVRKSAILEAYAKGFTGEWVLFVDADEFLELPYPSLTLTIDGLASMRVGELPARLMQRAHPRGILASLEGFGSIDEAFPQYDYRLAERMNVRFPIWKNKYPLIQIGPAFRLARGFHMPAGGRPVAQVPIRAVLHHFKWRDRLLRAVERRRGEGSNQTEQDAYRAWLEAHEFRLPTEGLKKYSRAALFEDGYLMQATSQETAFHAALHDAAANGSDVLSRQARRELAEVPSAIPQSDHRASGYLDRKWLAGRRGRIALVTSDLLGLRRAGGIGTAMSALAECLSAAGHHVDVFLAPYADFPSPNEAWFAYWESRGVHVRHFQRRNAQGQIATAQETSLVLADALAQEDWDVIHFPDAGGMGAASQLLRAAGTAFQATRFVVTIHGPTPWHRAGNLLPWAEYEAEVSDLERTSIALADVLVSPSSYMKKWSEAYLPSPAVHLIVPNSLSGESRRFGRWPSARQSVSQIVFFGRIEQRKGLDLFLSAVEAVLARARGAFEVVFLGSPGEASTLTYLSRRTAHWACRVRVITNYTSHEAVDYLRSESCLAVIPSRVDNSPYTVYECLENGIPFITSQAGGIAELIHAADRARVTVRGGADEYAARILEALNNGAVPARPNFDPALADADLLSLHGALVSEARSSRSKTVNPVQRDVTVIVYGTAIPEPAMLRVLERWSNGGVEVFLDRFAPPEPSRGRPADIGTDSRAPILNRLAQAATGAFILFCHASVIPQTESLAAMRATLKATSADAIVGGYRHVNPNGEADAVPVFAGPPELSTARNIYGARMFLVRRECFLQQGGFAAEPDIAGIMEREFLNRLHAGGGRILGVPSPIASTIDGASSSALSEYQHGRLVAPWVAAAPESQQAFVRMALRPDWRAGYVVPQVTEPGAATHPTFPGTHTPTVIPAIPVPQRAAVGGPLVFARSEDMPITGKDVKWELESQNEIGRLLIGEDGRLLQTQDGYAVRSVEEAEGCDFLLADDVVTADDSRLLVSLFRAIGDLSVKNSTRRRGNAFLRFDEMLEANAAVAPLIGTLRRAAELTSRFYDLATPLYPIHGRITQIGAGGFFVPPRPIVLPRAVADHGSAPRFGGALWLNDEFRGGDSYFTALDISVHSRPRRYIGHTASSHHELASLRVTSGAMLTMSLVMGLSPDEMRPPLRQHF